MNFKLRIPVVQTLRKPVVSCLLILGFALLQPLVVQANEVKLTIRGLVVDAGSQQPVEFATVAVINSETDRKSVV